jgi:hypothetical protein
VVEPEAACPGQLRPHGAALRGDRRGRRADSGISDGGKLPSPRPALRAHLLGAARASTPCRAGKRRTATRRAAIALESDRAANGGAEIGLRSRGGRAKGRRARGGDRLVLQIAILFPTSMSTSSTPYSRSDHRG